jgi:hypothetical protein
VQSSHVAVIIADPGDETATWVASVLVARTNVLPIVFRTPEMATARWELRIDANGSAEDHVGLSSGQLRDVGAIWCRARTIPVRAFESADPRDRDYATWEFRALVVAWLHAHRAQVVNAVDGDGIVGPSWSDLRWLVEGSRCGLVPVPVTLATSGRAITGWRGTPYDGRRPFETARPPTLQTVLVAGPATLGELAPLVGPGCRALAARAGCRLLEVGFAWIDDAWAMTWANPVPEPRAPVAIAAIADVLAGMVMGRRAGAP